MIMCERQVPSLVKHYENSTDFIQNSHSLRYVTCLKQGGNRKKNIRQAGDTVSLFHTATAAWWLAGWPVTGVSCGKFNGVHVSRFAHSTSVHIFSTRPTGVVFRFLLLGALVMRLSPRINFFVVPPLTLSTRPRPAKLEFLISKSFGCWWWRMGFCPWNTDLSICYVQVLDNRLCVREPRVMEQIFYYELGNMVTRWQYILGIGYMFACRRSPGSFT